MKKRTLVSLIPLAIAITFIYLAVYVAIQQNYRQNANDPQIQMAEDQAANLNNTEGTGLSYGQNLDVAKTLSTFTVVYDTNGKLITSITANGKTPTLPSGVFSYAKKHGEDRFTWAPTSGVRDAVVLVKFDRGYILVGRSLKEVEKRIDNLGDMMFIAWLVTLAALYVSTVLVGRNRA